MQDESREEKRKEDTFIIKDDFVRNSLLFEAQSGLLLIPAGGGCVMHDIVCICTPTSCSLMPCSNDTSWLSSFFRCFACYVPFLSLSLSLLFLMSSKLQYVEKNLGTWSQSLEEKEVGGVPGVC